MRSGRGSSWQRWSGLGCALGRALDRLCGGVGRSRAELIQPGLCFLHAVACRRSVQITGHGHIPGDQLARFIKLGQFVLGQGVVGGGSGLQQGQGALGVGWPGLAANQHVGEIGLGGGQARLGGPQIQILCPLGSFEVPRP